MKRYLMILSLVLICLGGWAQVDTEFWFAAPSLAASHTPQNIFINIVTYDEPAIVEITQPATGRVLLPQRMIAARSAYTFSIKNITDYKSSIETVADGTVKQTGIFIQASSPVTAYYVATAQNSEIYTLKGRYALGTDFIVPMQNRYPCRESGYASVEIVASKDNTQVTIQTQVATNEADAATLKTITLNRGESYAIRSKTADTPQTELLGCTRVKSDKPIAVNSTDDSATNWFLNDWGDKDLIGEQLVPTDYASSKYIVMANNSYNNNHEYIYFFSIDNPVTIYTTDGNTETLVATIPVGGMYEYKLQNLIASVFYTKDDTPFVCFQMTANDGGNELGGTILPSLTCSGSTEVAYVPALTTDYIQVSILTRTDYIDGFLVNDSPYDLPKELFHTVPGAPEWSYTSGAQLALGTERTIKIRNTKGVFHLGVLDAGGGACSYGYFSNFGKLAVNTTMDQDYYFEGEDLHLTLNEADIFESITWIGPKGEFGKDNPSPVIQSLTEEDAGMYIVSGTHKDGCELIPDTIYINVLSGSKTHTVAACKGEQKTLQAAGIAPFTWYDASGNVLAETSDTYILTATADATYSVNHRIEGLNIVNWTDAVEVAATDADSLVVWSEVYSHLAVGTEYQIYLSLTATKQNAAPPRVNMQCNNTKLETIAIPNGSAGVQKTMYWTADSEAAIIRIIMQNPKEGRNFRIDSIAIVPILPMTEQFSVVVEDDFVPVIQGESSICDDPIRLRTEMEYDSYLWSTGETTRQIEVTEDGTYTVQVTSGGCIGQASFTVDKIPAAQYSLGDIEPLCEGDHTLTLPLTVLSGDVAVAQCEIDGIGEVPMTAYTISTESLGAGEYTATLTLTDASCGRTVKLPFTFTILYGTQIFTQRWNDILAVQSSAYNGGYDFTVYEWYKNGERIDGTEPYLYVPEELNPADRYSVRLTRTDGLTLFSCEYSAQHIDYEGEGISRIYNAAGQQVPSMNRQGLYIRIEGNRKEKILIP